MERGHFKSIMKFGILYHEAQCTISGGGGGGVNRLTDQRILTVFSPGFRIQSKILTDLRILQLQRFAVFINFWARSLDFACDEVRIVDLSDRQKCLVLYIFVCMCALL